LFCYFLSELFLFSFELTVLVQLNLSFGHSALTCHADEVPKAWGIRYSVD